MFAQSICTADMPSPNTYHATYVARFTPRSQLIDFTWSKNTRYTSSYCKALAIMCTCSHLKTQKCSIVFNSRWFVGANRDPMECWYDCVNHLPPPPPEKYFSATKFQICVCAMLGLQVCSLVTQSSPLPRLWCHSWSLRGPRCQALAASLAMWPAGCASCVGTHPSTDMFALSTCITSTDRKSTCHASTAE